LYPFFNFSYLGLEIVAHLSRSTWDLLSQKGSNWLSNGTLILERILSLILKGMQRDY
jgi:hypothetical protein